MNYWRQRSIEVIDKVVREHGTEDLDSLKKAISAAYPFGERKWWPYKVWLSQVKRTMNTLSHGGYTPTPKDIKHWWVPAEEE